eukprot:CAMPEP_0118947190 /NCGR_PEP_ID=MMETSP1169-20130426/45568_1 /TAXON_ID=36882 /ORGANISM="Pyramimonas obovata, Strain CCMP722" /LENGTH=246 /DNA_ID=CAMNT_0006893357 /DNA_START=171 /DNA_END=907 /DNA_ORIENTATION=+
MASTRRQQDREAQQRIHEALEQEGFESFVSSTRTLRAVHVADQAVLGPSGPYKSVPEGAFRGAFAADGAFAAHGRANNRGPAEWTREQQITSELAKMAVNNPWAMNLGKTSTGTQPKPASRSGGERPERTATGEPENAYIERQKREKNSRAIFQDEIDDLLKQENYRALNVFQIEHEENATRNRWKLQEKPQPLWIDRFQARAGKAISNTLHTVLVFLRLRDRAATPESVWKSSAVMGHADVVVCA